MTMGKPRYTIILENNPAAEDVEVVHAGLDAYNRSKISFGPEQEYQPLNVLVRANDGTVMAGLLGSTFWGWLYVRILWVHEDLRGQDFGTDLMRAAEQEALRRGCHSAFVDTISFQALPFYQKLGYSVWGELEDFPPGHIRHYLKKRLQPLNEV
jgi:GNAT superfamily N-acetyltransferase